MTDISKVLQRKAALEAFMDPYGRTWALFHVAGTGLYEIAIVKETLDGIVPDPKYKDKKPKEVQGMFTNATKAEPELKRMLKRLWDESDEADAKRKRGPKAKAEDKDEVTDATDTSG